MLKLNCSTNVLTEVISDADCISCGEGYEGSCTGSKRDCGHHCNHLDTHDKCCWCPAYINDDGDLCLT